MFWNKLVKACHKKGTSPTAVVEALHMGRGCVTNWKKGMVPRDTTIAKLAEYLEVSPDYFFEPDVDDEKLAEYLEELKNRPEMRMLFSLTKGATKEDVEQAVAIIEALRKGKNG